MNKLLIVEDEVNMLLGLKENLEFESYVVDTAEDGKLGLNKILDNQYDLIILDVMLPSLSGFDICKTVRKRGIDTPIILLTGKGEEIDKVLGLELGADDYITKPFSLRELLARIRVILKRTSAQNAGLQQDKLSAECRQAEANPVNLAGNNLEILRFLEEQKSQKPVSVLVYHKDKIFPVKLENIAIFYIENEITYLITFDNNKHSINKTLEELEEIASSSFYRANRQNLVNRKAVKDVSQYFPRKLSVNLTIPFGEKIIISKDKVTDFLNWIAIG